MVEAPKPKKFAKLRKLLGKESPGDVPQAFGKRLIYDGNLVSPQEALDIAHLHIRTTEIVAQDAHPVVETTPLSSVEVPRHAFALLSSLGEVVTSWSPKEEIPLEGGDVLLNYHRQIPVADRDDRKIFYEAQLVYNQGGSVPVSGNLLITRPKGRWLHEYYFQARTKVGEPGDKPHVYYVEHPFHEETLGRPEKNTVGAVQKAKGLILEISKTK